MTVHSTIKNMFTIIRFMSVWYRQLRLYAGRLVFSRVLHSICPRGVDRLLFRQGGF